MQHRGAQTRGTRIRLKQEETLATVQAREPLTEIKTTSLNSGINKKEGNIDADSSSGLQCQESLAFLLENYVL